jgi:hypothetical protein
MCELEKQRMVSELEGKQLTLKNGICIPESGRFSCCNMHFVFITNFNYGKVSERLFVPQELATTITEEEWKHIKNYEAYLYKKPQRNK